MNFIIKDRTLEGRRSWQRLITKLQNVKNSMYINKQQTIISNAEKYYQLSEEAKQLKHRGEA